jgi:hypothetical protein
MGTVNGSGVNDNGTIKIITVTPPTWDLFFRLMHH